MTDVLSDKDATKLFNQISRAMKDGDTAKLDSLITEPEVPEVKDEPELESPTETPAVEPEIKEEDNTADPQELENPADPTPEQVEEPKVEDNSELAELKEQLARLTKENHSLKSQAGRVPHVQRRLKELDKKLEELSKKQTSPSNQTSDVVLSRLKGIQETDPELAKAIADAVAAATSGITEEVRNKERETLTALREAEYSQYQDDEASRLLEMYPNAPDVFASPAWSKWKQTQSPRVRGLAESDNADDVAFAFDKYARDMVAQHPELAPKEAAPAAPAAPQVNATAEKIEADRQRKKVTAAVVNTPSAPAKVSTPDDPATLFEKFSQSIRKERTG